MPPCPSSTTMMSELFLTSAMKRRSVRSSTRLAVRSSVVSRHSNSFPPSARRRATISTGTNPPSRRSSSTSSRSGCSAFELSRNDSSGEPTGTMSTSPTPWSSPSRAPNNTSARGLASTTLSALSRIKIASVVCSNSSASTPRVRVAAETVSIGLSAVACPCPVRANLDLRVEGLMAHGPKERLAAPAAAVATHASPLRQDKRGRTPVADEHATHNGTSGPAPLVERRVCAGPVAGLTAGSNVGSAVEQRLYPLQLGDDQLRHVHDLRRSLLLSALAAREHDLAERAAGRDDLGACRYRLREALLRDASLTLLLFLPELSAAGAAAERVVAALLHLHQRGAATGEHVPRRVVLAVVPAQVTGVVEGDAARLGQRRQAPLGREALDQLRVVHDLVVAAELRVVVDQGVEAVRAGGKDDLAGRGVELLVEERVVDGLGWSQRAVERGDVLARQLVVEVLVARSSGRIAGAALSLAEHGVVDLGVLQDARHGARGLLGRRVVGTGAADEEQHLEAGVLLHRGDAETLGPLHAPVLGDAPGVAGAFHAAEGGLQLGRELPLHHDQVAADV